MFVALSQETPVVVVPPLPEPEPLPEPPPEPEPLPEHALTHCWLSHETRGPSALLHAELMSP